MPISDYISAAMREARYEILNDGSFYGEIKSLRGVWANADTLEDTRQILAEVLEEWLLLSLSKGLPVPSVASVSLQAPTVA